MNAPFFARKLVDLSLRNADHGPLGGLVVKIKKDHEQAECDHVTRFDVAIETVRIDRTDLFRPVL